MSGQYRATPEQWALVEQYAGIDCYSDSVILELRDRLAIAEQRMSELEGNHPAKPDSSAPAGSLVERVRTAIVEHGDGFTYTFQARAAIRAVAAAAKDLRFSRAETLIDWLEREAKRG